jgi:hypothetical protein
MALKGTEKPKTQGNFSKYVGIFNANVVAVNPTKEELGKLLDTTIEKDLDYTGVNEESGAKKLTLSFWLKEDLTGNLFNVRFGLEDTIVKSKTDKFQFINNIGTTSYAESEENVPSFLTENGREIRKARKGEELLYNFLRKWLSNLNYEDSSTELMLDWKKLISGKTTEIKDAINDFKDQQICALATVRTTEEGKEYQAVYSYDFLPSFALDCFTGKKNKNYKSVDRFIQKVSDREYGCKDYYELKPMMEYDPSKNVVNNTDSAVIKPKAQAQNHALSGVSDDLPF